ncbi:hypothetical protein AB0B28_20660 [Glycomyces sp. NPDC046736]|uniref:hypothetical protein n=1 Tax=Glycomyces sp. NPDC046736 TaxID=3155615 RepID=UPI00340CE533
MSWTVMFEPSWVPGWWTGVGVGGTAAAGLGLFATALVGRLRRKGVAWFIVPFFTAFGLAGLVPAFDATALAMRGVEVGCTVASKYEEEHRGTMYVYHVLECPGWPSPTMSTKRAQQLDVGEAASAVLDPEGRTHPDFDGVDWAAGPLWAAAALAVAAITVTSRIVMVDDEFRAKLTRGIAPESAANKR